MAVHLYLSMIPEALIASMLTPEQFGAYYAVGSSKKSRGQAIFAEIVPDFRHDYFRIEEGIRRCVPHEDGTPKASIYVAVYRVLEHVPLDVVQKFYVVTQDGRTLGLDRAGDLPAETGELHLYQEIAPVHPLVASSLGPREFYHLIVRNPTSLIYLPAICFVELRLGEWAADPIRGTVHDLPYANLPHLRQCLIDVKGKTMHTKMVNRIQPAVVPYRTVKNGFFMGNAERLIYFPLPSQEELRTRYYPWWRSANM